MTNQALTQVTLVLPQGEERVVDQLPLYIGRRLRSDLVIQDPRVSNTHCALELGLVAGELRLLIRDLRSRNGTMIRRGEGELIVFQEPTPLQEGDELLLGDRGGEVSLKLRSIVISAQESQEGHEPPAPPAPTLRSSPQAMISPEPPELTISPVAAPSHIDNISSVGGASSSPSAPPPQAEEALRAAALELAALLEPEELISATLSALKEAFNQRAVPLYYPVTSAEGEPIQLALAPRHVPTDAPVALTLDPERARLSLELNKLSVEHRDEPSPQDQGERWLTQALISPVLYQEAARGVLHIGCAHPPFSQAERHLIRYLSQLLGARLHSAYYYQALKRSAEALVDKYQTLYQEHEALLHSKLSEER